MNRTTMILRLEGLCVFVLALWLYAQWGKGWVWFAVLFLVPDLSFGGYLAGPRVGAMIYNVAHAYVVPLGLAALSMLLDDPMMRAIALIWIAHIGIDRAVGYGLKHRRGFKFTHLGKIGGGAD